MLDPFLNTSTCTWLSWLSKLQAWNNNFNTLFTHFPKIFFHWWNVQILNIFNVLIEFVVITPVNIISILVINMQILLIIGTFLLYWHRLHQTNHLQSKNQAIESKNWIILFRLLSIGLTHSFIFIKCY